MSLMTYTFDGKTSSVAIQRNDKNATFLQRCKKNGWRADQKITTRGGDKTKTLFWIHAINWA